MFNLVLIIGEIELIGILPVFSQCTVGGLSAHKTYNLTNIENNISNNK